MDEEGTPSPESSPADDETSLEGWLGCSLETALLSLAWG